MGRQERRRTETHAPRIAEDASLCFFLGFSAEARRKRGFSVFEATMEDEMNEMAREIPEGDLYKDGMVVKVYPPAKSVSNYLGNFLGSATIGCLALVLLIEGWRKPALAVSVSQAALQPRRFDRLLSESYRRVFRLNRRVLSSPVLSSEFGFTPTLIQPTKHWKRMDERWSAKFQNDPRLSQLANNVSWMDYFIFMH